MPISPLCLKRLNKNKNNMLQVRYALNSVYPSSIHSVEYCKKGGDGSGGGS